MPFGPIGGVTLDGIQFSTDPEPYEPLNWQKRFSAHMAVGGKVSIQDFGTFMKDDTVRLGSGGSRFLEESVMKNLHTRYRTKGVTYTLTDWLDDEFEVFMKSFIVIPWKQGIDNLGATISLWTYTLELQVVSITKLVGVAYTGS